MKHKYLQPNLHTLTYNLPGESSTTESNDKKIFLVLHEFFMGFMNISGNSRAIHSAKPSALHSTCKRCGQKSCLNPRRKYKFECNYLTQIKEGCDWGVKTKGNHELELGGPDEGSHFSITNKIKKL